jgi:hypothetical protein
MSTPSEESDGVYEKRIYPLPNRRGDVSVVVSDTGRIFEFIKYSAYGAQGRQS